MLRGVSGGERKRVTTTEMLVGPKRMLMADEISTGLDSATLFSIIQLMCRVGGWVAGWVQLVCLQCRSCAEC